MGVTGGVVPHKRRVFEVDVSVTDYDEVTAAILEAGRRRRSFGVTALATHGLMEAAGDPDFARVVNNLDIVTPDGQPVRWALNRLHGVGLSERVYGPDLMLAVCAGAADAGIGIYLLGSTRETCDALANRLHRQFPELRIADVQPDRFREATPEEDAADVERINGSGAGIVFVGRGCPRQERWVEAHLGRVTGAMVAVGAAFDYHAGNHPKPPAWMQRVGLEWLFRLAIEPRRLFRRYAVTNTRYLVRLGGEMAHRILRARGG
jgi:N-acetylglucosaminyldiphosphoundecaprenol N-acetyl-beta-D-mannosaminyltransferase